MKFFIAKATEIFSKKTEKGKNETESNNENNIICDRVKLKKKFFFSQRHRRVSKINYPATSNFE